MIVDVTRKGVAAIWHDEIAAQLVPDGEIRGSQPTGNPVRHATSTRVMVEVLRRFGGHAPRALIGGELVSHDGDTTTIVVQLSREHVQRTCRTRLYSVPFIVGMPDAFAAGVLAGLSATIGGNLPAGVLTIDRGGFDEIESSTKIFELAASVLGHALIAELAGRSVEVAARDAINGWPP